PIALHNKPVGTSETGSRRCGCRERGHDRLGRARFAGQLERRLGLLNQIPRWNSCVGAKVAKPPTDIENVRESKIPTCACRSVYRIGRLAMEGNGLDDRDQREPMMVTGAGRLGVRRDTTSRVESTIGPGTAKKNSPQSDCPAGVTPSRPPATVRT